jgi:hypothetical protein
MSCTNNASEPNRHPGTGVRNGFHQAMEAEVGMLVVGTIAKIGRVYLFLVSTISRTKNRASRRKSARHCPLPLRVILCLTAWQPSCRLREETITIQL